MKEDRRAYLRRSRLDGDQVVMMIVVLALAWSCWTLMRPPEGVPQPIAAGDAAALAVLDPALQPGWVHRFDDLALKQWWTTGTFEHHLRGQVAKPGRELQLRPWLYTSAWLPQPVVNVAADGSFDAVVYFSPFYDGPVVMALELEDRRVKQVVARVNYYFRPAEGARR